MTLKQVTKESILDYQLSIDKKGIDLIYCLDCYLIDELDKKELGNLITSLLHLHGQMIDTKPEPEPEPDRGIE